MIKPASLTLCATLCVARGGSLLQQEPPSPTFHSGTRLVEVEVVVRDKNGPVKGLTKDDFTVLDQGRPQAISIFRAGAGTSAGGGPVSNRVVPNNVVSNRVDSRGQPLNGATVVLLDQLNTGFDLKAYERLGVTKLLRSLTETDRIALYSLGQDLHIVQDFTDDPQKLIAALAKLDQGLDLQPADIATVLEGFPDPDGVNTGNPLADGMIRNAIEHVSSLQAGVNAANRDQITVKALLRIIQHLAGVSGRKNLVWLMEQPAVPPIVMAMAQQANISLYPVLIRGVGDSGALSSAFVTTRRLPAFLGQDAHCTECSLRHAVEDLGAATGGAGFTDAMDLTTAVRTAEEDSANAYLLGYYPTEEMLDGRYHAITVKLANKSLAIRYRPGYLATKVAPPAPALSEQAMLDDPLDSTGIGLAAELRPDPAHPGMRQVQLTVDLHDVHLEAKDGRVTGAFEVLLAIPATHSIRTVRVPLDLPAELLDQALQTGYTVVTGGVDARPGELRVVVRDPGTNAAGSLRVPIPQDLTKKTE
jgi:VWFA-related protein